MNFAATRFVDPCHGSEYDESGYYLGGPSPRSMDRLPLEVQDGLVFFEPSGAIIQVPRPGDREE